MITVTNKAVEKISKLEKNSNQYLRIYIQGGGCSGFQYAFAIDVKNEGDTLVKNSILVDPTSFMYLDGAQLDWEESLEGSFFTIKNPNAMSTCGCGSSFGV